jgi:hypothetical protein
VTEEQFQNDAIEIANAHTVMMSGMNLEKAARYMLGIIADSEVVIAVWQEGPNQVGFMCVKGTNKLFHILDGARFSAIPCRDWDHAAALQEELDA